LAAIERATADEAGPSRANGSSREGSPRMTTIGPDRLAALRLCLVEVPTIPLAGLSEAERRALILADNQLTLAAGWDEDLFGENKLRSTASIRKAQTALVGTGYGGHFRAVQGFRYVGAEQDDARTQTEADGARQAARQPAPARQG
jgi:hypothetical protein